MKITQIKPILCHAYRTNWVFVKVTTDEGITGVGEATLEYREKTVAEAILECNRLFVGRDPHQIEALWHEAYRSTYFRGGPVYQSALSGVEMALWDIKGKALGVPVYQLLGGKIRDSVPCYANGWFAPAKTPAEFAAKAKEAITAGFQGLKWDPFGSAYLDLDRRALHAALDVVAAVKDAVGADADLLIEGHGRFNIATAVRVARALEPFDILWFEEPVPPDHFEALLEVKNRSRVPIAGGERLYSRWEASRFLELGCADYIQPDVSHCGGIGELKKIAAMAEARHRAVAPHNPSGPVANAASLQLAACVPNYFIHETMAVDVPWRREICDEKVKFEGGRMFIPDRPGLGIELDEAAIAAHPYEPKDLRHYAGNLTDIRPKDATGYFSG
ncbi:MAG: galactonate dehydratase [Spirochaetes bacterium]|nr:galactonate dehydratase [Spirochaetota bacterium]